jgi:hypothetical protein
MADRITPIRKTPAEILTDLVNGHSEARHGGAEKGMKYLLKFSERNTSLPNAVKFFLYDLLAEDAFKANDLDTCRTALVNATEYLPVAQSELPQRFAEYAPLIRLHERAIALAIDDGELEKALSFCDEAISLGLGRVYVAKRASIERML